MAEPSPIAPRHPRRALLLLGLGAVAGLACAALGLLRAGGASRVPAGAVASVNGEPILAEDFARLVAALEADRRGPVSPEDRLHVLDRLIDEELLVQRGLELGLSRHDRRVRADLTSAVIASVLSESDGDDPTSAELQAFYAENRDFFTQPGRLWLRQVFVRPGAGEADAQGRAREAARRLRAGEPLDEVAGELGDPEVAPLPDSPLPALKLREYLGPTALRTALGLAPGEVSDPVRSGVGFHVLVVVAREPDRVPPLEEIDAQVRSEYRRRSEDQMLRRYLDQLRRDAEVRVAEGIQ